jgi:hypothetical protein
MSGNGAFLTAKDFLNDGTNGDPRPSSESRGKNANVNYIIKT